MYAQKSCRRTIDLLGAVFGRLRLLRVLGGCILPGRSFGFRVVWEQSKGGFVSLGRRAAGVLDGGEGRRKHMHVLVGAVALLDGESAILKFYIRGGIVLLGAMVKGLTSITDRGPASVQTCSRRKRSALRARECRNKRTNGKNGPNWKLKGPNTLPDTGVEVLHSEGRLGVESRISWFFFGSNFFSGPVWAGRTGKEPAAMGAALGWTHVGTDSAR